jgi:hypothetical protein
VSPAEGVRTGATSILFRQGDPSAGTESVGVLRRGPFVRLGEDLIFNYLYILINIKLKIKITKAAFKPHPEHHRRIALSA